MENYNIRWNGFLPNTVDMFRTLLEDTDIADVTLVTEDEKQIRAHKVALSSSSPFFRNIFVKNPQPNPIIVLPGVLHSDMLAILKYIYTGEVELPHDDLENFIHAGNLFKVKGLKEESPKPPAHEDKISRIPIPAKLVKVQENAVDYQINKHVPLEELTDMRKGEGLTNMEWWSAFSKPGQNTQTSASKPQPLRQQLHGKNTNGQKRTSIDISEPTVSNSNTQVDMSKLFGNPPTISESRNTFGFLCDDCKEMFESAAMLTRHRISEHKAAVSYCCNRCDFQTKNKNQLIIHKAMRHTN